MNDKVTLQAISDLFARQYGISKKTTDAFGKAFFDTIVDGLNKDGAVKIKGLGTFKIVEVGSRESVNVTNGERIVIDGYRKVTFVPDELAELKKKEAEEQVEVSVAQATEQALKIDNENIEASSTADAKEKDAEPIADKPDAGTASTTIIADEEDTKSSDEAAVESVEERAAEEVDSIVGNEDNEPRAVEVPADEFSGIDLLISTPESIMEVENDLEAARIRAEKTLEEAKQANVEYRRLELLLERLKSNVAPESAVVSTEEENKEEASTVTSTAALASSLDVTPISEPLAEPEESTEPAASTDESAEPVASTDESAESVASTDESAEAEASEADSSTEEKPSTETPKRVVEIGAYEDDDDDDDNWWQKIPWLLILLIVVALTAAGILAYRYMKYEKSATDVEQPEQIDKKNKKVEMPDTTTRDTAVIMDDADVRLDEEALKAAKEKERADKEAADKEAADKAEKDKAAKEAEEKDKKELSHSERRALEKAEKERKAAEREAEKAEKEKREAERKAKEAAKRPKTHVVATGENLYRISRKYYGTNDSVKAIVRLNKITDPNNVTVGHEIKLP